MSWTNKEKYAKWARMDRAKDPSRYKGYNLKRDFGLSLDDYNKMLVKQNNCCSICKQPETAKLKGKIKALSVDHNHVTKKVRGLLCGLCNSALGKLKENKDIIKALLEYIEKHN